MLSGDFNGDALADLLIKFNSNLANKYKSGVGLKYLDDYINAEILEETIREFLKINQLRTVSVADFEFLLKQNTKKDIDWFFDEFVNTRKKLDFKIVRRHSWPS